MNLITTILPLSSDVTLPTDSAATIPTATPSSMPSTDLAEHLIAGMQEELRR